MAAARRYYIPDDEAKDGVSLFNNPEMVLFLEGVRAAKVKQALEHEEKKCFKEAFELFKEAARIGDAPEEGEKEEKKAQAIACCKVGLAYNNGVIVPKDEKESIFWFETAVELGNEDPLYLLGIMHLNGYGTPKNPEKAFGLFERAANKKIMCLESAYMMSYLFENGIGIKINILEAFKWYELAAKKGSAYAKLRLALKAFENPENIDKGKELLRQAAIQGNVPAQVLLAKMYIVGHIIEKNIPEALIWLEKAEKQNYLTLELKFTIGKLLVPDHEKGNQLIKAAAEERYLPAINYLADDFYENRDSPNAIFWHCILVDEFKNVDAAFRLAKIYLQNNEHENALKLYLSILENRTISPEQRLLAQYNIGQIYMHGKGLQNPILALHYSTLVSDATIVNIHYISHIAYARHYLASEYVKGTIVTRNYLLAAQFYFFVLQAHVCMIDSIDKLLRIPYSDATIEIRFYQLAANIFLFYSDTKKCAELRRLVTGEISWHESTESKRKIIDRFDKWYIAQTEVAQRTILDFLTATEKAILLKRTGAYKEKVFNRNSISIFRSMKETVPLPSQLIGTIFSYYVDNEEKPTISHLRAYLEDKIMTIDLSAYLTSIRNILLREFQSPSFWWSTKDKNSAKILLEKMNCLKPDPIIALEELVSCMHLEMQQVKASDRRSSRFFLKCEEIFANDKSNEGILESVLNKIKKVNEDKNEALPGPAAPPAPAAAASPAVPTAAAPAAPSQRARS